MDLEIYIKCPICSNLIRLDIFGAKKNKNTNVWGICFECLKQIVDVDIVIRLKENNDAN